MKTVPPLQRWVLYTVAAVSVPSSLVGQEPPPAPSIVIVRSYDTGTPGAAPSDQKLGFIVESQGLVLTSSKVLQKEESGNLRHTVRIELVSDGRSFPAAIVGIEPTLSFAILKVESDDPLPGSKLCPREKISVGQLVRTFTGMEEGEPSYGVGRISKLNNKECYQGSMTAAMLRAELEIPQSSIGGPVFNNDGEVVAIYTGHEPIEVPRTVTGESGHPDHEHDEIGEGEVYLLPIFLVSNIYESLKLRKSLKSPWTGFSVRPITDEERLLFPFKRFRSAVGIEHVWKGGPAEKLGIVENDLLVGFSYYKTNTVAEFQKWLYAHGVGFEVKLYFLRDGKELRSIDYTIEERPSWAVPR